MWPDARSALVVGLNYGPKHDPLEPLTHVEHATISVYAQNVDYHDLMKRKLKQLILLSMTMGVMHFSLIFTGMRYLDAATSSIAVQLQVPFAATVVVTTALSGNVTRIVSPRRPTVSGFPGFIATL